MEKQVQQSLSRERLVAGLSAGFGGLALVLACIGLYGVLAYAVTRRTNEIGIRMALGASRGGMVWLILREAMGLASSGMVTGVPAVWALARISRTLLYGVGCWIFRRSRLPWGFCWSSLRSRELCRLGGPAGWIL